MKKAVCAIFIFMMLAGFGMAARAETGNPVPLLEDVSAALNELTAFWGAGQYPADVGGMSYSAKLGKAVVLLVRNTAARQVEIRRLVSVPNALIFLGCKYSYSELQAVHGELARRMLTGTKSGIAGIGIGAGFGMSGYEFRVIVTAASQEDSVRLSKELSALYGDKVHIGGTAGGILSTDGGTDTAAGTATATGSVNVRTGPGTNYQKLGRLKKGQTVEVLAARDGWAEIAWSDGQNGYVSMRYLKQEPAGAAEAAFAGPAAATGNVNVRTGPGTNYQKLGRLKKGQTVEVLAVRGKWAKIAWIDGQNGYVHADYLKFGG